MKSFLLLQTFKNTESVQPCIRLSLYPLTAAGHNQDGQSEGQGGEEGGGHRDDDEGVVDWLPNEGRTDFLNTRVARSL